MVCVRRWFIILGLWLLSAPFNQLVIASEPEKKSSIKIVVIGDSLTAGYGVEPERAYPVLLESKLQKKGYNVVVINAGISGSTTAGAASRLRWQLKGKFDVLVLALGANDGLRGLEPKRSQMNLGEAIDLALKSKLKVMLAGMKMPQNYGKDYQSRFEKTFRDLADKYKAEKVVFMPYLLQDVGGVKELNQPDGIHPNEKGQETMAENILPYIEKLLNGKAL